MASIALRAASERRAAARAWRPSNRQAWHLRRAGVTGSDLRGPPRKRLSPSRHRHASVEHGLSAITLHRSLSTIAQDTNIRRPPLSNRKANGGRHGRRGHNHTVRSEPPFWCPRRRRPSRNPLRSAFRRGARGVHATAAGAARAHRYGPRACVSLPTCFQVNVHAGARAIDPEVEQHLFAYRSAI